MSTSAERQRRYRARAMARGYRRVMFFASPATQTALDAWRANGQTTDEIIRIALESLSEKRERNQRCTSRRTCDRVTE